MSRYKNILVLAIVLLAQFLGLAVQIRRPNPNGADKPGVRLIRYWSVSLMSPPEKGLRSAGGGISGLWANYIYLRHVREQNRNLQQEISRLRLEQAGLMEDARQGQRLQQLLSFKEQYIYKTVPAQVIGTSGTDQSRVLYLDKGAADGLKPDMPVITPDGIVGKLRDVFPHTSQVLEISDQTSGAGVLLETTRLRGVLRGNSVGQPQMVNMLPDDRIKPGERVITSGGDQIYPRGLPVGVVERVVPDKQNDPYVDIVLRPAANLARLEEVLVVTQTGDKMPSSEQSDIAQSQAEAMKQRASDVLSERLPGLIDPNNPAPPPPPGPVTADGEIARPLKPGVAAHPDRFTPNATPPANILKPGQPLSPTASVVAANTGGAGAKPSAPKSAAPKPAAPKSETGSSGSASPATPKVTAPKPAGAPTGATSASAAKPAAKSAGAAASGTAGATATPVKKPASATAPKAAPKPAKTPVNEAQGPETPKSTKPEPVAPKPATPEAAPATQEPR